MSKERNELNLDGRAAFYAVLFNGLKEAAADLGYTLAIHGSMIRDMDLIAIAWTEEAKPVKELVSALSKVLEPTVWKASHFIDKAKKPHGRLVYTLSIYSDWYIDLSIIPPRKATKEKGLGKSNLTGRW